MARQNGNNEDWPDGGGPPGGPWHPESVVIVAILVVTLVSALLRLLG